VLRGDLVNSAKATVYATFFDVDVRRAHIVGGPLSGFELACGHGTLEDLQVEGVQGDGLRLAPMGRLELERVRVRDARLSAVRVHPLEQTAVRGTESCAQLVPEFWAETSIDDLDVQGGTNSARGLVVCAGGPTDVRRARIAGARTGLYVQGDLQRLEGARVSATEVGVSAPEGADLGQTLLRVEVDGEQADVERRPDVGPCP